MMSEPRTLKQIREDERLTLEEFGAKIGYSVSTVQGYEAGEPSEKYLGIVCEKFGIPRSAIRVDRPLYLRESPAREDNPAPGRPETFESLLQRTAAVCLARGHLLAAQAILSLLLELDARRFNEASAVDASRDVSGTVEEILAKHLEWMKRQKPEAP